MLDYKFARGEKVLKKSTGVHWVSRNNLYVDDFVLTNKNLYCAYKQHHGLFRKTTKELAILSLADIKPEKGHLLVEQKRFQGKVCLRIQFQQGSEYFSFDFPCKRTISKYIKAISSTLHAKTKQEAKKEKLHRILNPIGSYILDPLEKLSFSPTYKDRAACIEKIKGNYLLIKARPLDSFSDLFRNIGGLFQVIDPNGKLLYTVSSSLHLCDAWENEKGFVEDHYLLQTKKVKNNEIKKCSIHLGNERIAVFKKTKTSVYPSFTTLDGNFYIDYASDSFKIRYNNKTIATVHRISSLRQNDNDYVDKYIVDYHDVSYEVLVLLLVTAVDNMC